MTAFRWAAWARFSMATASSFCVSVGSPGSLGQSMLATVATHTARNSRSGGGGASSLSERFAADSHLGTAGGLAMMVFVLLYVPCLATVGVMKQETGSWAWTLFSVFYSTGVAYLAALMIYQGGTLLGI